MILHLFRFHGGDVQEVVGVDVVNLEEGPGEKNIYPGPLSLHRLQDLTLNTCCLEISRPGRPGVGTSNPGLSYLAPHTSKDFSHLSQDQQKLQTNCVSSPI